MSVYYKTNIFFCKSVPEKWKIYYTVALILHHEKNMPWNYNLFLVYDVVNFLFRYIKDFYYNTNFY